MKTKTFDFHVDPGHGWLKVPRALLIELGIHKSISHYSYQRGDFVYLEEDGDFGAFVAAMKSTGVELRWRTRYADRRSRIRSYASYAPHIND